MSDILHGVANTMPVWRDLGVMGLAAIVVGLLQLYAALLED